MKVRVLIVDDHELILYAYRRILDDYPELSIVGEARDGVDAVEKARTLVPALVIIDITIPLMTGIDAAKKIIQANPDIKVIISSVHSSVEHVSNALQAGATGYIVKGGCVKDLLPAIRQVMAGKIYISSMIPVHIRNTITDRIKESPLASLSNRERQVVKLIAEGKTHQEAAAVLGVDPRTIDTYKWRAMKKLEIDTLPELLKFAYMHGIVSLE